jgi:hypothetical protein
LSKQQKLAAAVWAGALQLNGPALCGAVFYGVNALPLLSNIVKFWTSM